MTAMSMPTMAARRAQGVAATNTLLARPGREPASPVEWRQHESRVAIGNGQSPKVSGPALLKSGKTALLLALVRVEC